MNGTAFIDLPRTVRSDLTRHTKTVGTNEQFTLEIPGKPEYNEISVQFLIVLNGGDQEQSEPAFMIIQGINA